MNDIGKGLVSLSVFAKIITVKEYLGQHILSFYLCYHCHLNRTNVAFTNTVHYTTIWFFSPSHPTYIVTVQQKPHTTSSLLYTGGQKKVIRLRNVFEATEMTSTS